MTRSILSELARREKKSRLQTPQSLAVRLLKALSPIQVQFVMDKHRLKTARCGRRAGKSYADIIYMIIACHMRKGANVLYLGITQSSAMEIIWQPLLDMLHRFKIPHRPYPSNKTVMFPNGSKIKIFGADSENAKNRLRGVAYDLVIVDECGFVAEVDELVDIVLPSVADYGGTICLTSSPPEILHGLFYEADIGKSKQYWHQYNWSMLDNPFFMGPANDTAKYKSRAEEEMALVCALKYGGDTQHPAYRREYLGEWVRDASNLIYPYTDANLVYDRPAFKNRRSVIGLDFGVTSSSAISVIDFDTEVREACVVDVWKEPGVLVDDFATILRTYIADYNPIVTVADAGGLGKVYVNELVKRYGLPIRAAEKLEKETGQKYVANDLISKYLKVLMPVCQPLTEEWSKLSRDKEGKEPKKSENHLSDATLYGYRHVYTTAFALKEKVENEEEKMLRQLMEQVAEEQEHDDSKYY